MAESSRAAILRDLRQNGPAAIELPGLQQEWVQYPDPCRQFAEVLESVGGRAVFLPSGGDLNAALAELPAFAQARKVASLVDRVPGVDVDLAEVGDPHQLEDVDFFVAPGELAVAENGAVWVTAQRLPHRVLFFIAQHLALVVDRQDLVHNLPEAYQRIRFAGPGFGLFISGPSKTADIEQSLVIGAHGPRSLTVFLS